MPKISRSILKGVFSLKRSPAELLKGFVGASLVIFGLCTLVLLVGGLVVPKSVLLKLSNAPTDDIKALSGSKLNDKDDADEQDDNNPSSVQTPSAADTTAPATGTAATSTSGASAAPTGSSPTPTPTASTGGGGGTTTTPATPTVVAPSLTFAGSPTTITSGASSVLSWSVSAGASPAPTCTASGGWSGAKATSGSQNVTPGSTATYTLVCSNSAGQSSKSVSITVNPPASTCGTGGSCTLSEVQAHATSGDCWMIVTYTASGGNGTGRVYKIASGFFGGSGSHTGLPGAPSLSAASWCGKNISSTFNSKHSGGSRSDGSNTAIWWLTNNGNSFIGNWSGN